MSPLVPNGTLTSEDVRATRDSTGRVTTTYDALQQVLAVRDIYSRRTTYAWDGVGRRAVTWDVMNDRYTCTYDAAGRLTRLSAPKNQRTTFAYDTADRRTVKRMANGTRASFTYDITDRLTRVVDIKSSEVTISSFAYRYDNAGNRLGVTESTMNETGVRVTWTYDNTYQLTRERRSGTNSFDVTHVYDPAGNRTVKIDSGARTTAVYDAANRLTYTNDGTGRTTYTYDANGNQTRQLTPAGARTTSVWDYENMNTSVQLSNGTRVTYTYTAERKRMKRQSATQNRTYVYDGNNLFAEIDASFVVQVIYALEPLEHGRLISQRIKGTGSDLPASYHHYDALGSTIALTGPTAVQTDSYIYTAFGETKSSSGTTTNLFTWVGELGYIKEVETGEHQADKRPVQPALARWKSEDPLGPTTDSRLNPFGYVENNPVNGVDPSGQLPESYFELGKDDAQNVAMVVYVIPGRFFDGREVVGFLRSSTGNVERMIGEWPIRRWYAVPYAKVRALLQTPGTAALDKWTAEDWDNWFRQNDPTVNPPAPPAKPPKAPATPPRPSPGPRAPVPQPGGLKPCSNCAKPEPEPCELLIPIDYGGISGRITGAAPKVARVQYACNDPDARDILEQEYRNKRILIELDNLKGDIDLGLKATDVVIRQALGPAGDIIDIVEFLGEPTAFGFCQILLIGVVNVRRKKGVPQPPGGGGPGRCPIPTPPSQLQDIVRRIRSLGRVDETVQTIEDARTVIKQALPNAVELPAAVAGKPYPNPPKNVKAWYQMHPAEPSVGNNLPHFKYVDWSSGKRGAGGKSGHIFFTNCD